MAVGTPRNGVPCLPPLPAYELVEVTGMVEMRLPDAAPFFELVEQPGGGAGCQSAQSHGYRIGFGLAKELPVIQQIIGGIGAAEAPTRTNLKLAADIGSRQPVGLPMTNRSGKQRKQG